MAKDELTLKALRAIFLDRFRDEPLFSIYEMIYDKYQEIFLQKFEPFYNELLLCLDPKKQEEIERDLFAVDIMINICNYLYLSFYIYKLGLDQKINEKEVVPVVAWVLYKNEKEKIDKEEALRTNAKAKAIEFFLIYSDLNTIESSIESLMLMPTTIMRMTQTKTESISEHYEAMVKSLKKSLKKMRKDAQHGKKFKGKELSPENEKIYKEILAIQEVFLNEYGPGHSAGLSKSVRTYNQRNKCNWSEAKIKSTAETIRKLREDHKI